MFLLINRMMYLVNKNEHRIIFCSVTFFCYFLEKLLDPFKKFATKEKDIYKKLSLNIFTNSPSKINRKHKLL